MPSTIMNGSEHTIELVVLDLVGTLVADDGQVDRAFADTLSAHGLQLDSATLVNVRGLRKRDAIVHLVALSLAHVSASPDRVYESFRANLAREYRDAPPRIVEGAAPFLDWAATCTFKLAVNTGLDRELAGMLLDAVPYRFHAVVSGDEVAESRPAPFMIFRAMESTRVISVRRVAVVGDTASDLQAGRNAGVRLNIGTLTGAHSRERLIREPHTHLIEHLAELPPILESPSPILD